MTRPLHAFKGILLLIVLWGPAAIASQLAHRPGDEDASPIPHGTRRDAFVVPGAAGILEWPPHTAPDRLAAVVILHDALGGDGRSDLYAAQLLGAGMAVLDLLVAEGDGIATAVETLVSHPRIDGARLGVLGFGAGAGVAAALPLPFAARALLYPGCQSLPAAEVHGGTLLLLHGDKDPANPTQACAGAAERFAAAGWRVTHRVYPHATYAWDYPQFAAEGSSLLPGGGTDLRVRVEPWPALGALSAAEVAAFFSAGLGSPAP